MPFEQLTVAVLREVFRNLHQWIALYVEINFADLEDEDFELSIQDALWLFDLSQSDFLSQRQSEAIAWFLVENGTEEDVAVLMGIAPTNPVGMYATAGLAKLVEIVQCGGLDRRRWYGPNALRSASRSGR